MKKVIITYNIVEGFHYYPKAPEHCVYLQNMHRHLFVIRCRAEVSHNEREIEINTLQNQIERELKLTFGNPCLFDDMSCESIAQWLLERFEELCYVEVLEDEYGGAALTR